MSPAPAYWKLAAPPTATPSWTNQSGVLRSRDPVSTNHLCGDDGHVAEADPLGAGVLVAPHCLAVHLGLPAAPVNTVLCRQDNVQNVSKYCVGVETILQSSRYLVNIS